MAAYNTYSPGSLNVAVVVDLPANAAFGGILPCVSSTAGLLCANVTSPGPRNLLHVTVTGAFGRILPGDNTTSSATHRVKASGWPTIVLSEFTSARGPCVVGPFLSKLSKLRN